MLECRYILEVADSVGDVHGVVDKVKAVVKGMEGMEGVSVEYQ